MSDPTELNLTALAVKLKAREVSAVDVIDACLRRIERLDPSLNAFSALDIDHARNDAEASDARKRRIGPLDGIPVAVKENIDIEGLVTRSGLGPRSKRPAERDAAIIRQLRAKGAIILGHTNMHEGALGATNDNPHHGRSHNPWRHDHTPGGSSGGSAVAVAARMCPLSLGTDTMGSIRLPAAYCGLVGYKPSRGRVSNAGIEPLYGAWDQVGPMTRTIADLHGWFEMISGSKPSANETDLRTLRIACPDSIGEVDLADDVRAAFDDALNAITSTDLQLSTVTIEGCDLGSVRRAGLLIIESEATMHFESDRKRYPSAFSRAFADLLDYGAAAAEDRVMKARSLVTDAGRSFTALFEKYDLLIMPTAPQTAFSFDDPTPSNQADLTALANVAGAPAISLPIALSSDRFPVGLQVIGAAGSDNMVLSAAAALEGIFAFQLPRLPKGAGE